MCLLIMTDCAYTDTSISEGSLFSPSLPLSHSTFVHIFIGTNTHTHYTDCGSRIHG